MNKKVVLSFSGGKDSCLALYELLQQNINVECLLTTVWTEDGKTVAHGEELKQVTEQAKSIGIPIHLVETDFQGYTEDFVKTLEGLKKKYGINGIAYGDIYLDGHREWGEHVAFKAGLDPMYPIWTTQENVLDLLKRFVELDFKAKVIKVDRTKLPKSWIGRSVDESFIRDVVEKDICPMGESGEYHTTVYNGPIFQSPVQWIGSEDGFIYKVSDKSQ